VPGRKSRKVPDRKSKKVPGRTSTEAASIAALDSWSKKPSGKTGRKTGRRMEYSWNNWTELDSWMDSSSSWIAGSCLTDRRTGIAAAGSSSWDIDCMSYWLGCKRTQPARTRWLRSGWPF